MRHEVNERVSKTKDACAASFVFWGGPKEIRTPDPLIANEVLYQLSYGPNAGEYSTTVEFGRPWQP